MLALLIGVLACATTAYAAEERYDYDALGRLIRVINEQGHVTEYVYDPSGNILQVIAGAGGAQAPVITSGALGDFRRNEFRQITVSGSNLTGVAIRPSHSGIDISNAVVSASSVSFRLAVGAAVPLGAHHLIFQSATGTVNLGLNVLPALIVTVEFQPIVVPPDSLARQFTLRLSEPATQLHTFSVDTISHAIARVTSATVSIPPGQITADFGVVGVAVGATMLRVYANFVEGLETLVTVASGAGNRVVFSRSIGIVRGAPWAAAPQAQESVSKSVGIVRGAPWTVVSQDPTTISKPVGIVRGAAAAGSASNTVVSPLVGITKP